MNDLIASFHPVQLAALDSVKLTNRMDSKYIFRLALLPEILKQLYDSYNILEIDRLRRQNYETLYFDTSGLRLYLDHHNKRLNRFKVRSRTYLDTGACYFEIKRRNNKARTIKERIRQPEIQEVIAGKQEQLLASCTNLTPDLLSPSLWVNFSRITLVNHGLTERVTIDTGLTFRNQSGECAYPGVVIAEVKQDRLVSSVISGVLHRAHVPAKRVSKYCLGIASLNQNVKKNNFKQKINYINKLNHDPC